MKIRIGTRYEDWDLEKVQAQRAQRAEARARYTPDPDEGWLSVWAGNQTDRLLHLIESILDEPEGVSQAPHHCGLPLREIEGQYGAFYRCRSCDFKAGWSSVHRGRAKAKVEWREERWLKAIDMDLNGNYGIYRASSEPLRITAGQLGLG